MKIKVKPVTGHEIDLEIDPNDKVSRIKDKVEKQTGVPPQQQRLTHSGKQMPDDKTASQLGVKAGDVLNLSLAVRGGGGGSGR